MDWNVLVFLQLIFLFLIRCLLSFFIIYPQIYADSKTADNRRFWVINSANELICCCASTEATLNYSKIFD